MNQQAANVVDLAAYRTRRAGCAASALSRAVDTAQAGYFFAMPVMLPVVVGWLPVWIQSVAVSVDAIDQ